jgi:hypothetical protein
MNHSSQLFKYPRTYHLPWSEGVGDDDKIIPSLERFIGQEVVVTEKMDGENTTLYPDTLHARSIDGRDHPSRHWLKSFWSGIRHKIPEGTRICGENLYAKHSIHYTDLPSYFLGFSAWRGEEALSWDDTLDLMNDVGIRRVPVLYVGTFDEQRIRSLWNPAFRYPAVRESEGYVVRVTRSFKMNEFRSVVAKFVRPGHVQTNKHWSRGPVYPNGLADEDWRSL